MPSCPECGTELLDRAFPCPKCSPEAESSPSVPREEVGRTDPPGRDANDALRLFGLLNVVASVSLAIWVFLAFGTYRDPLLGDMSSPVAIGVAVALVVQALVVGCLFFALAAMGDNLIGIRRAVEGRHT